MSVVEQCHETPSVTHTSQPFLLPLLHVTRTHSKCNGTASLKERVLASKSMNTTAWCGITITIQLAKEGTRRCVHRPRIMGKGLTSSSSTRQGERGGRGIMLACASPSVPFFLVRLLLQYFNEVTLSVREVEPCHQEQNTLVKTSDTKCTTQPPELGGCRRVAFTSYNGGLNHYMNTHPRVEIMKPSSIAHSYGALSTFKVKEAVPSTG